MFMFSLGFCFSLWSSSLSLVCYISFPQNTDFQRTARRVFDGNRGGGKKVVWRDEFMSDLLFDSSHGETATCPPSFGKKPMNREIS